MRRGSVTQRDVTPAATAIVRTLEELPSIEKRATLIQLVKAWRGVGLTAQ